MLGRITKGFCQAAANLVSQEYKGPGFTITQFRQRSLAIFSYLLRSGGQAVLIDPIANILTYRLLAEQHKLRVTHVLLSHYHADYLAAAGYPDAVTIYHRRKLEEGRTVQDGHEISVGQVKVQLIHTPGHTLESSCYLLKDSAGKADSVFTGDTIFLNEVGRPDLAVKTNEISAEQLAGLLFDSVQKVKKLPKQVRIFPGHGSGSACGKSIGDGLVCDLSTQLKNSYALKLQSRQQFITQVLKNMPVPPAYFFNTARLNISQSAEFSKILAKASRQYKLTTGGQPVTLLKVIALDQSVLKHPKSVFPVITIAVNPQLQFFAGAVVPTQKPLVLIAQSKQLIDAAIERLIVMGYSNIEGNAILTPQLQKQLNFQYKEISSKTATEAKSLKQQGVKVLDIRSPDQIQQGALASSTKIQFTSINKILDDDQFPLKKGERLLVHCRTGGRASHAAQLLRNKGYEPIVVKDSISNVLKQLCD